MTLDSTAKAVDRGALPYPIVRPARADRWWRVEPFVRLHGTAAPSGPSALAPSLRRINPYRDHTSTATCAHHADDELLTERDPQPHSYGHERGADRAPCQRPRIALEAVPANGLLGRALLSGRRPGCRDGQPARSEPTWAAGSFVISMEKNCREPVAPLDKSCEPAFAARRGVPPCRLGDTPELRRKLTSADERFHTFSEAGADLCFGDEGITRVGGAGRALGHGGSGRACPIRANGGHLRWTKAALLLAPARSLYRRSLGSNPRLLLRLAADPEQNCGRRRAEAARCLRLRGFRSAAGPHGSSGSARLLAASMQAPRWVVATGERRPGPARDAQ